MARIRTIRLHLLGLDLPIPVPIFTSDLLTRGVGARTFGVFVAMSSEHETNIALEEHELVHVHQFYRSAGINAIRYFLSSKHRYKMELEAYRRQLTFKDDKERALDVYSWYLANRYSTNITQEQARADLEA